jgi:hypothetical protein
VLGCLPLRPNWLPQPTLPHVVSPLEPKGWGQHSLGGEGEGGGGSKFGRLERKPDTLSTLWVGSFRYFSTALKSYSIKNSIHNPTENLSNKKMIKKFLNVVFLLFFLSLLPSLFFRIAILTSK